MELIKVSTFVNITIINVIKTSIKPHVYRTNRDLFYKHGVLDGLLPCLLFVCNGNMTVLNVLSL